MNEEISAHDEMARAIRAAIGLLEDEEMAVAATRVEAALWALRKVASFANGPAVDLDAAWNAFSLRPGSLALPLEASDE